MNEEKEKLISKLKIFFRDRAGEYSIEAVSLYGSWAAGLPRKNSDIDLAVVFSPELESEEDKFSRITDISYAYHMHIFYVICRDRSLCRPYGLNRYCVPGVIRLIKKEGRWVKIVKRFLKRQ